MKHLRQFLVVLFLFTAFWVTGCQTSATTAGTEENRSLAPQRVDIRGSIVSSRYSEGQTVLEVEAFSPSPNSLYDRAYVLVLPTAQIIGRNGEPISLSELQMGQNVAILLRAGGKGNRVGIGVARKLWVEDRY